jgi:chromosome partitioning protein
MSAFDISVVNSKGGVGKTTTAVALAHLLGTEGGQTTLIDLDRQGSALAWAAEAEATGDPLKATVTGVPADTPPARLARLINTEAADTDWLVIDTPPGDMDRIDAAVEAVATNTGVCLIPTSTSKQLDIPRALITIEDIGDRAPTLVLLTKTRARTVSLREARADLVEAKAETMTADVPHRESVVRSTGDLNDLYRPVAMELLDRVMA